MIDLNIKYLALKHNDLAKILLIFFVVPIYPFDEKNIVVIIPSFQNELWCEKNLLSVFFQDYVNWHALYIDDASTDDTLIQCNKLIKSCNKEQQVTIIHNKRNLGVALNLWLTIHNLNNNFKIKKNDIVLILDGDDWYNTDRAFSFINQIYNNGYLATYSGLEYEPDGGDFCVGIPSFVKRDNAYRKFSRHTSQQRSFYAQLFKKIKLKHFFRDNKPLDSAADIMIMFAIYELSSGDIFCLRGFNFYTYNRYTPINDDKVRTLRQWDNDSYVRSQKPYRPKIFNKKSKATGKSIVVVSDDYGFAPSVYCDYAIRNITSREFIRDIEKFHQEYVVFLKRNLASLFSNNDLLRVISVLHKSKSYFALELDKKNYDQYDTTEIIDKISVCQNSYFASEENKISYNYIVGRAKKFKKILKKYGMPIDIEKALSSYFKDKQDNLTVFKRREQ